MENEKELAQKMKEKGYEVFEIKHDSPLQELFQTIIKAGISTFKKDLVMMPAAFIVSRNMKEQKYHITVFPMYNRKPGDLQVYMKILKKYIKQLELEYESTDNRVLGVVRGMEGASRQYSKDLLDKKGNLVLPENYVNPTEDPEAKTVLIFQIEEEFYSHTKFFEYIMSPDKESVVVSETPLYDIKETYNHVLAQNMDTSYMFTRPQSQN